MTVYVIATKSETLCDILAYKKAYFKKSEAKKVLKTVNPEYNERIYKLTIKKERVK